MFKWVRNFRKRQEGSATIEFVILFPAFIFLFLTGFESGYYMVRNVMLERAVDLAVRDVRLGNGRVPDFVYMKAKVCSNAGLLPDCMNSLQIEMQPVAIEPGGTAAVRGPAKCVDKLSTADPRTGTTYEVGAENNMMMVRVCALAKPLFPSTGIGVGMQVDADGNYALVATSAFVNEPGNRSMAITPPAAMGVQSGTQTNQCNAGIGNGGEDCDPGNSASYNAAGDDAGQVAANTGANAGGGGNGASANSGSGNSNTNSASSGTGNGTSGGSGTSSGNGNSGNGGSTSMASGSRSLLVPGYGATTDDVESN